MSDEPSGHRGHPTTGEVSHSDYVRQRLGACIVWLGEEGFAEPEAVSFIAGVAYELAAGNGETWHSPASARKTVVYLLEGRAAKWWSLGAVAAAIQTVADLRQEEGA